MLVTVFLLVDVRGRPLGHTHHSWRLGYQRCLCNAYREVGFVFYKILHW